MRLRTTVGTGIVTALALTTAAEAGGPIAWASAASGDWNVAGNWNPATVPGIGNDVLIGLSGAYTVALSQNQSAASVNLTNPNATLQINGFRTLTVDGDLFNQGLIVVNPTQVNSGTRLVFSADANLTGSGTLVLNHTNGNSELITNTGVLLTQGAGHTIKGRGRISATLVNQGLVLADMPGDVLTLITNDKNNQAQFRAENGAALSFEGIDVPQGPSGEIVADGTDSEVRFSTTLVDGGGVRSLNGGKTVIAINSTFRNVDLQGPAEVSGFRNLSVEQGLTNDGILTVNPTMVNSGTSLTLIDGAPLNGAGEVVLAHVSTTSEIRSSGAGASVHGVNHTIRGRGRISAAITNEGLISADSAGGIMELTSNPKTNNARIEAVNGGTLDLQSFTLTQSPGGVITADGPDTTVRLSGPTIISGTLSGLNGGLVSVVQNSTAENVVLEGAAEIQGFRFLNIQGTLTNNGVIRVNPTMINSGTGLRFADGAVLTGSGRIVLEHITTTAAVSNIGGGMTMTQAAGHTIEGRGRVDATMTNNGLINANVPTASMDIFGTTKTNNGDMVADNGGRLNFFTTDINQSATGLIQADGPGSIVDLAATTITGGTLESTDGGLIQLSSGNATLDGVALRGETVINGFRFLDIDQGTTLNGRITVNPALINAGTGLRFLSDFTLEGNGVIRLAHVTTTSFVGGLAGVTAVGLGDGIRLEGIGRVQVPLTMHGEIAPGLDGVGSMSASSPVTLTGTSSFEAEVAGNLVSDQFASTSTFHADGTLDVSFVDGFNPPLGWAATIVTTGPNGVSGEFATVNAPQPTDSRLVFRVVYNTNQIRIGAFCKADTNLDGSLNIFDIQQFINLYNAQDPAADLAAPFGAFNIFDIQAFVNQYNAGCP